MNEQADFGPVRQSATLGKLAAALAKFQGSMSHVTKDKTVKTRSYSYSYADLASVIDASREPLAANEIAVVQSPSTDGAKVTITTLLLHSSGEWVSGSLTLTVADGSAQVVGSALSYARRYALLAMLGIATEDDDGESASRPSNGTPASADRSAEQRAAAPPPAAPGITPAQAEEMESLLRETGVSEQEFGQKLVLHFGLADWHLLSQTDAWKILNGLRAKKSQLAREKAAGSPGGATPAAAGSASAKP